MVWVVCVVVFLGVVWVCCLLLWGWCVWGNIFDVFGGVLESVSPPLWGGTYITVGVFGAVPSLLANKGLVCWKAGV